MANPGPRKEGFKEFQEREKSRYTQCPWWGRECQMGGAAGLSALWKPEELGFALVSVLSCIEDFTS